MLYFYFPVVANWKCYCRFQKIFPTPSTHQYHQFFEAPRYYNMLLDAWETKYHNNRHEGKLECYQYESFIYLVL